jgi:anti-sigma regulatory factor (Ser/Thr protein kinase)
MAAESGAGGSPRDTLSSVSALDLPPSTESVPVARRFARREVNETQADVDTVVLLVSEVVTNAVLHARSDIRLNIESRDDLVRVEVRDASPLSPRLHHFRLTSGTGRGLRMLERLARRWGVEPDPAGAGKVVWFEVGEPDESSWEFIGDDLLSEGVPGDF